MATIHPTALVEDGATLGAGVEIGPYCLVGRDVTLGPGCRLISHAVVTGRTTVGPRAQIFPFASIGHRPQDLKFKGEDTTLDIGADSVIREHVTMNPGTEGGGGRTVVGNGCVFLAGSHVAHDCILGDGVILSNNVMLAGHCRIGDHVIFGGGAGIHQFGRVGSHAFIGGMSAVAGDVIPYGMVVGNRAYLTGLNIVGLRRRGFSREDIHTLRRAYRALFADEGTLKERIEDVASEFPGETLVEELLTFLRDANDRAICIPRSADVGEGG